MFFLQKIRQQPVKTRKAILWGVIIILGVVLLVFWLQGFNKKLQKFSGTELSEKLGLPELQEKIKNIDVPSAGSENFGGMGNSLENATPSGQEPINK